ncbi:3-oxoacyl-[acyl-carrier protein] reductase (EC [Amycolatopsis camponoti]|uniref:3-oxoacyl-[acyl-carrier protein] reductase (EC) n=1 Tax=Amycolatopsis camponoti TaxID=2606593 RepID=A0A6I8LGW7_9PSEU|nr:SDR family NAD(P)-dependent oxidoreductase [Amycolatopsis camponoti]VVJ16152.1 3-oxoacyl-[acyl-carrier protein] reductase (EC [Amycolatopsis camponoti]
MSKILLTTVQTPVMLGADRLEEEMSMGRHDLSGRAALVTGGAGGLGAEMAAALAEAGAAVVIADVREDQGRATADALKQTGAAAVFVRLDVTDDASWERAVGETIAELGGLDIVVANAGVEISGLIADLDPAGLRRMLDVNVLGTALAVKHAFRAMRPGGPAGKGGAVVTVASVDATVGGAGYSATKSAVDRLTRVAAMEAGKLGYDVRVNCLYPGPGPTGTGPRPALGEVTDLAGAVVFLASDAARFVTGAGLPVDGDLGP